MSLVGAGNKAATASMLPSPLRVAVVKQVFITLVVGLFTLALLENVTANEDFTENWETPPAMETFISYEDMQRYFDHRNLRRLRHLDNPLADSYIEAFNYHNEQESLRSKRSADLEKQQQPQLNPQPALIKFEMSDAVEPSDEVKELIRQYKSRELQQNEKYLETVPPASSKKIGTPKRPAARPKRSTKYQQPANFKVQYIPFDESDAREPDAHTKILIKRMRALETENQAKQLPLSQPPNTVVIENSAATKTTTTTKKPVFKRNKYMQHRKPRRFRREAPAAPEMIKFEISDAKDPDPSLKTFMKTKQTRDAKELKLGSKPVKEDHQQPDDATDTSSNDQSGQASKRYFVLKEAPVKVKKSVAAIPRDVQNIISHIIKGGGGGGGGGHGGGYGGGGGKAYLKYLPAQKVDYNYLKMAYPLEKGGGYGGHFGGIGGGGGGGGGYGKYAHAVPVKFVYHPVVVGGAGGHGGGGGYGGEGAGGHMGEGGSGGGGEAGHEEAGAAIAAVPIKYVALAGVGGGEGGGYAGGEGGEGGGYGAAEGGHGGGGGEAGGYESHAVAIKYIAPVVGGEGGGYGGNEEAAAGEEEGYAAEEGLGGAGKAAGQGGGENYALIHAAAYANYEAEGGGAHGGNYAAAPAAAPLVHPIVVAEGGGQAGKNAGNEVIKNIPAPQFKGEVKYSVVPTVEQYAKTPTQDFHLKLYSPESLIAKAQLEAKDKAKAIAAEGQKAVAAAYKLAAAKAGAGYSGGAYGGKAVGGSGEGKAKAGYGFAFGEGAGKGGGGGGGYGGGKIGAGAGPVIKIEYHAPAESFKGNYKDLPEFKQLSSLVGKSPEDQIHGLTYLLAKEMQNRLHLQRQYNYGGGGGGGAGKAAVAGGYGGEDGGGEARPQDNKAPVLFHPEMADLGAGGAGGEAVGEGIKALGGGVGGGYYQPIVGKYIGMGKSKQYIPVIEQAALEEFKGAGGGGGGEAGSAAGKGGGAKNAYAGYGLSANYKGLAGFKGGLPAESALKDNGYEAAAAKLQSYASKYAFGYRIRDFSTGNDFGHKQNRDLHGVTRGQYHILLPDGRIQNVIYHADDTGFHADVSFESGR